MWRDRTHWHECRQSKDSLSNRYLGLKVDTIEPLVILRIAPDNEPSIEPSATFIGKGKIATARALLDSGATGNILNQDFVRRHRIQTQTLEYLLPLKTVDGSESKVSTYTMLVVQIQDSGGNTHEENNKFYIANIGKQDIIIGTGWLIKHNPDIDWKTYQIRMIRCPSECKNNHPQLIHSRQPRNNSNIQACKIDVADKTEDHNIPDQWTATVTTSLFL